MKALPKTSVMLKLWNCPLSCLNQLQAKLFQRIKLLKKILKLYIKSNWLVLKLLRMKKNISKCEVNYILRINDLFGTHEINKHDQNQSVNSTSRVLVSLKLLASP